MISRTICEADSKDYSLDPVIFMIPILSERTHTQAEINNLKSALPSGFEGHSSYAQALDNKGPFSACKDSRCRSRSHHYEHKVKQLPKDPFPPSSLLRASINVPHRIPQCRDLQISRRPQRRNGTRVAFMLLGSFRTFRGCRFNFILIFS
jgi:hypothetical protein